MKQIFLIILGLSTFIYADFSRDSINGTVTDNTTGLVWQDDQDAVKKDWENAIAHCEALVLGSEEDWRLPNKKELFSIVDYGRINPSISSVFEFTESSPYWSSTTGQYDKRKAWAIIFDRGYIGGEFKSVEKYIRCVRAGQ